MTGRNLAAVGFGVVGFLLGYYVVRHYHTSGGRVL